MRVLHVYSGNLYGGIETILSTLARRRGECDDLEPEFALCFEGRLGAELRAAAASVHQLGEARVSRPHSVRRARRALASLLASRQFDCVVCHAAWAHALFGRIIRRAGVPLVAWVHDSLRGRHWTERWAMRTPPDLLVCNSRFTSTGATLLFPSAPHVVVYAPVELPAATISPRTRLALRAELTTPADAVVIVQASRLEPWKGHEDLLHALAAIRGRRDWTCWIAGGPQRPREAEYRESLQRLAARLNIAERVRFAGERRDVAALLRAADIHCQPNTAPEPFGIAFVEALAAGLPVVTTALGGATEIVDDSCGRLVPPSRPETLAHALDSLIAAGADRAALASAGPGRARALCDAGTQIRRLAEMLATVAAGAVPA